MADTFWNGKKKTDQNNQVFVVNLAGLFVGRFRVFSSSRCHMT
jgi:hypothetical protein